MFISNAYAQTATGGGLDSIMGLLPIILMFVILYFLMIRPQMKRAKEHRALGSAKAAEKSATFNLPVQPQSLLIVTRMG